MPSDHPVADSCACVHVPVCLCEQKGLYSKHGVRMEWHEQKLGTGAMLNALKADEVDVIVALTEGLVSDIAQGSDVRLIGTYVESPLCWAISTGPKSPFNEVADLKGQTIGISRFTSGSHLMSCVLASQRGWQQSDVKYEVLGSFENLRRGVIEGRTAAFMWERFMQKPFYDSGEIRCIGEMSTPWPCFLMATRQKTLESEHKRQLIEKLLHAIRDACHIFASTPSIISDVARRFGLREDDARDWYNGVHITASNVIYESTIETSLLALRDAGVLTKEQCEKPLTEFVDTRLVELQADIKTMRLYHKPELVTALFNNIRVRLGKEKGPLSYRDLLPYDQNHYGAGEMSPVAVVEDCARLCSLTSSSRVIQLGSNVGGPSRLLAGSIGCEVLAVELQEDLHAAAQELTRRCGLADKVHHVAGDFLQVAKPLASESYDCIPSWLTVLHFDKDERSLLFRHAFRLLKPGGCLYVEDFIESGALTPEERHILRHDVYCKFLPSLPTYKEQLKQAGFVVEYERVMTSEWTEYTKQRHEKMVSDHHSQVAVHGSELVDGLTFFYSQIRRLFESGHCGGIRIIAKKPTS